MVLEAVYQMRRSNLPEVTVDGKHLWCFLAPTIAKTDGQAVAMSALFSQEYPKHGRAPIDQVTVARRDGDHWTPVTGYLRQARTQTMVEKGQGDPAPVRELSVLCRQRIEILKPILAALKQEAAQR